MKGLTDRIRLSLRIIHRTIIQEQERCTPRNIEKIQRQVEGGEGRTMRVQNYIKEELLL